MQCVKISKVISRARVRTGYSETTRKLELIRMITLHHPHVEPPVGPLARSLQRGVSEAPNSRAEGGFAAV